MNANNHGAPAVSARMTPKDVARRLNVGTRAVYSMLEQGILPAARLGQRWLITRHAYEEWEKTCGLQAIPHVAVATPRPRAVSTGMRPDDCGGTRQSEFYTVHKGTI